ncbi:conserved hypothetical protein [Coccidioides posadasii str. Silveira]|uniref:Aminoglycoside phosphotransferase domain-containing protein n=1 Tax=Coccidioides posadasii (strain RMSCC 757 / Silveira) TaxID=443226 RepID=E9D5P3_COCPS|nr:conserved hypothetical protein [Coccidioides posadasii str. Silveira]
MNEQTLAGFNPSRLIAPNQVFHSAIDYIFMIHQALLDEFHLRRDSVCGESDAHSSLYGLHNSRQFLMDWVKPEHNHGPFVLMHGDLRSANILVDDDLNIVSVLDWEWSHTIPLQMFVLSTLAQWLRSAWNLEGIGRFLQSRDTSTRAGGICKGNFTTSNCSKRNAMSSEYRELYLTQNQMMTSAQAEVPKTSPTSHPCRCKVSEPASDDLESDSFNVSTESRTR